MENLVFRLKFDCDNAAFEGEPTLEVARILRELADALEHGNVTGKYQNVRDLNGNIVGTFRLTQEG